ncbi:MAG: hypothetical protein AVDCRST_MAG77-1793 [uncultured Chloroflexi bacterium]|uniref:DUF711 family protein n=1 Tax=uncultured Chloroflexota bacterium TaxID=166587 RepID=A0A6J4I8J9_9CHLR|nr:MAG: hypothetical protein AVDCRST_MAG77-1793 [uncultured Chloroflexota bacterium]
MKIRAVTVGAPVSAPLDVRLIGRAAGIATSVAEALAGAGYEVQTVRLATPPLERVLGEGDAAKRCVQVAVELDSLSQEAGFGYVTLGALDTFANDSKMLLEAVPEVIASTQTVFCAASVGSRRQGINLGGARACGELVARVGAQTEDGFGNLRFAALANCSPHIPFFPAAYHDGGDRLTVGIALEAADVAVEAFEGAGTLQEAQERLCRRLAGATAEVELRVRQAIGVRRDVEVTGVDLSLAPFPADDRSIAHAFERLGLPAFGAHGTLFTASFLTGCLQQVWESTSGQARGEKRFGFSGLMLPVLEDSVLAARAAEGRFGVDSLLLYSAVCGLGLDTVPLPGDTSPEELGAIILDMAALAVRLDKPLTARLFPVPGKRAGDPVSWDFAFFAPSRVLPVRGMGLGGVLAATAAYNPAL